MSRAPLVVAFFLATSLCAVSSRAQTPAAPAPAADSATAPAPAPAAAPAPSASDRFAQPPPVAEPPPDDEEIVDDEGVLEPLPEPERNPMYRPGWLSLATDLLDVSLHGQLQVHGVPWTQEHSMVENGDPADKPGFRVRRARMGLEALVMDDLFLALTLDLFDKEARKGTIVDAYMDYTLKNRWFGVTAGLQKFPFARGYTISSRELLTIDRPMAIQAMAPGRVTGVTLHSEPVRDRLRIHAGVYNGLQRKSSFHEGFDEVGATGGNRYRNLVFAARVEGFGFGPIGESFADYDHGRFRLLGSAGFYYDMGDTVNSMGVSGAIQMKCHGFAFLGETLWDRAKPAKQPAQATTVKTELSRFSAYGIAAYTILPRLLTAGAFFEYMDDNTALKDQGDEVVFGGVAEATFLERMLKVSLQYQHREERYGPKLKNDAVIGQVLVAF